MKRIVCMLALLTFGCVDAEPKPPGPDIPSAPADPCKHVGEPGATTTHCFSGWIVECNGFEAERMTYTECVLE